MKVAYNPGIENKLQPRVELLRIQLHLGRHASVDGGKRERELVSAFCLWRTVIWIAVHVGEGHAYGRYLERLVVGLWSHSSSPPPNTRLGLSS